MYRVQKLLSKIGFCSRRTAEQLIKAGHIKINEKLVTIGDKWSDGDVVKVKDVIVDVTLAFEQKIEIIKYNKPIGEVVSMNDPHNTDRVFDHLPEVKGKWINIGRLDLNTSGLILFTNNGDLANRIMHPSNNLEREYILETNKPLSEVSINRLLDGVEINDGQIGKFDYISYNKNNFYKVILSTGKNREIRNSVRQVGMKTISLKRIRYAKILLDDLREGEYRYLNIDERAIFSI
tara:strand:- start:605 stop:1309 length:705 start_codon:yes stop_codon:yes gene_type:complete